MSGKREASFPNLRKDAYEVTSNEDGVYNCIAHAADKNDSWWWPLEEETEGVFWPDGVDREETVGAVAAAFRTEGYRPCEASEDGPGIIEGFEKVAIYTNSDGFPSHAAKRTADGK